jgi:hypothetical protein
MGCLTGDRPSEEQVTNLCELVDAVTEVTIYRYVEECACAFQAGAYRAAMVAGWCAVAGYLRELVRGFGEDFAKSYWDKDKEIPTLDRLDGPDLLAVCDKLRYFDSRSLNDQFGGFWNKRCECAHPSGIPVTCQEVLDHVQGAKWLLKRSLHKERIQDESVILEALEKINRPISKGEADHLIKTLKENKITSLSLSVLKKFFVKQEDRVRSENFLRYSALRHLWDVLYKKVPDGCQARVMEVLEGMLAARDDEDIIDAPVPDDTPDEIWEEILKLAADINDVVETPQIVRFLYWDKIQHNSVIWAYLYVYWRKLNDDDKEQFCAYAPDKYRELLCDS